MQGPAICLGAFHGEREPFGSLDSSSEWAASLGATGVSLPTHDARLFQLAAAGSEEYLRIVRDVLFRHRLELAELSVERQTRLIAVHPAYDAALNLLAPENVRHNRAERDAWAAGEVRRAAVAARQLGATRLIAVSGSLVWPYLAGGPARPAGIIETGFAELARRWLPLLDHCDAIDVDVCFTLEPGQDVHDGASWERFLAALGDHRRARLVYDPGRLLRQQIEYLEFIDLYADRIGAVHASDAEVLPNARQGICGSFDDPSRHIARPRSVGDGEVDVAEVFERLAAVRFDGWVSLDWADHVRDPQEGAAHSIMLMKASMVKPAEQQPVRFEEPPFDEASNRRILGLD